MTCHGLIQYHLGGTLNEALKLAPMKLLVNEVRLWGISQGHRAFHLGGGTTADPDGWLEIYHGMYLSRMEEALETDYEQLKSFLGPRAFRALVASYVQAYPSRSYSLNPLGRHLADYIEVAPRVRRRGFCGDLARLEWAMAEVFDATETALAAAPRMLTVRL